MTRLDTLERLLTRVVDRRRPGVERVGRRSALRAPPIPRDSVPEPVGGSTVDPVDKGELSPRQEVAHESVTPAVAERSGPSMFVSSAPTEPRFGAVLDQALRLRLREG